MIGKITANLTKQENDVLYLENNCQLIQVNFYENKKLTINQQYTLYLYQCWTFLNKNYLDYITYGFTDLDDLIIFEKLIKIDGIGFKTAIKLLQFGNQTLVSDILSLSITDFADKYQLNYRLANNVMENFNTNSTNKLSYEALKKMQSAIKNLSDLGYSKNLCQKIIWKNKHLVLDKHLNIILPTLIKELQNEKFSKKTK